ncbi:MAG: aminoacyl-tRNA hydrolase [Ferruginibacter sp.]
MSKYLLVGLGNIGKEYANTRHNIGFDVVNTFVLKHGGQFRVDKLAYVAEVKYKGKPVICICPTQYMNQSGRPFLYWMNTGKVPLENTLTIVDDIALPLDKIRIRPGGSAGGHNGLRDIEAVLGTADYPKLRFGIGNNFPKGMQADFVLSKWLKSEEPQVLLKVEKSVEAIESFIHAGIGPTMTAFNQLSIKP